MIGGRIVFHQGKLLTLDEAQLRSRAEEAAHRLDLANVDFFISCAKLARLVGAFCAAQGCDMHGPRRKIRAL
jgi:hypothetical protein